MRSKSILKLITFVLVLCSVGAFVASDYSIGNTTNKPLQKLLQKRIISRQNRYRNRRDMRQFLQQQQAYPDTYLTGNGVAAGSSDTRSKKIWAVAIGDPRSGDNKVVVGFKSVSLRNTGSSSWPGITVTITADVSKMVSDDYIDLFVAVFKDGTSMGTTANVRKMRSTGNFSVTSRPFEMEPNHDYYAIACFTVFCSDGEMEGIIGTITDIKWNI